VFALPSHLVPRRGAPLACTRASGGRRSDRRQLSMKRRRPKNASQLAAALIEQGSDAIALVDEAGTVLYANPATSRMLGIPITDITNTNVARWVHEDDLSAFRETISRRADDPDTPVKTDFRLRHGDGTWRHIEGVGVNRLGDPRIRGIIINLRDVTENKRAVALEDQLRQAQKMEAIGRLASGVAHDFNNVLTAILGSADLLSMKLEPTDPRWVEADAIKRAADRGAALTKKLLSFGRPERSHETVVDVVATVGSMEPMLRRLVLNKIAICVTASTLPLLVRAQESALSQIVLNLVINARDAMPDGGSVTIDMGLFELRDPLAPRLGLTPGPYAGLSVTDTGQGIPPEVRRHLFEPFFSTKPTDQGTGLGLSIVYGIVKGLGGAIEMQSEGGSGTTFMIYIPLVVDGP
jgi:two-component system cell cycle sensor histidine kinase/response regulator CckA